MEDKLVVGDFFCDVHNCPCLSFTEIFYQEDEDWNWSYICLFHFIFGRCYKDGWCLAEWLTRIPLVRRLWNWWAKVG